MIKSKKVLIIGAGEMQVPIIGKCREMGYDSIVTDADRNAPGMKIADVSLVIDTLDKKKTLEAAKKYKVNGVVTTSDYPVRTVAYVAKKLKLKGLSEEAAEICTNKYLLREKLSKSGIDCPEYWRLRTLKESEKIKEEIPYPVIIKPVDSSASRGVTKVLNKKQLRTAIKDAQYHSKDGSVIIEKFLEGREFSVESLTQNGKTTIVAITEKTTSPSNSYFVEERHVIPANINSKEKKNIEQLIYRVVRVIGLNNCGSHTELKLTERGPIIIEIGARLGGDYITSDLVPLSTGINMLKNIINISVGKKINVKKTKKMFSGVQFVNSENYNFAKIYLDRIRSNPGLVCWELKKFTNQKLKSSLDRLGYYICVSSSREDLLNLLDFKNK